jgi:hypothetical protein
VRRRIRVVGIKVNVGDVVVFKDRASINRIGLVREIDRALVTLTHGTEVVSVNRDRILERIGGTLLSLEVATFISGTALESLLYNSAVGVR